MDSGRGLPSRFSGQIDGKVLRDHMAASCAAPVGFIDLDWPALQAIELIEPRHILAFGSTSEQITDLL